MSDSDNDQQHQTAKHHITFADDDEILRAAKSEGKVCAHATCPHNTCLKDTEESASSSSSEKKAEGRDSDEGVGESGRPPAEGEATEKKQSRASTDDRKPTVITHTNQSQAQTGASATTTSAQEVLHINTSDEYISVENIRLFYLSEIPLDKLDKCIELEVRKNLIHDMIPFPEKLRGQLQKLDLFDNKIKHIAPYFSAAGHPLFQDPRWLARYPGVTDLSFAKLRVLDLSYNQIRHISGLEALGGTLEELFLVENKIKAIENISHLAKLRVLELGGNQLRGLTATCLQGLVELEELWVGKNKIAALEPGCFAHCPKLRLISLQANRLTDVRVGVFSSTPGLQQLHLSENGLRCIENIGPQPRMKIMDFSFNPISTLYHHHHHHQAQPTSAAAVVASSSAAITTTTTTTSSASTDEHQLQQQQQQLQHQPAATARTTELTVENFPELEEFWLTDAKVSDWREISVFAPFDRTLRTIYLERTPLEDDRRYRDKIYQNLPFLTQIDSWPIVNKSNPEADRAIHRR